MYVVECDLIGKTPLSFGKVFDSIKNPGEKPDDYEMRCRGERIHKNANSDVFIPALAVKKMLDYIAKYLGEKIPGKGQATYTKNFGAGVLVVDDPIICDPQTKQPIKAADVPFERVHSPADGRVGGTTRVWKYFPTIKSKDGAPPHWFTHVKIYVNDPVIGEELIKRYMITAGELAGLGRYRPSSDSRGHYGRFDVASWKVTKS